MNGKVMHCTEVSLEQKDRKYTSCVFRTQLVENSLALETSNQSIILHSFHYLLHMSLFSK